MSNSIAETKTFWQLLNERQIIIPIIQRDYAQGRYDKIDLRKKFLGSMKSSLTGGEPLLLDFVYGTETDGTVCPLDGQQRLTTLWLLHWYALYKEEKADAGQIKTLQNFSYETRVSSRDFVKAMVERISDLRKFPKEGSTLSEQIQIQKWFYSGWKQDPTVQAMLTTLSGTKNNEDGIEQLFKDVDLAGLFDSIKCPISFYYLNLDGIKQSDSIYVKMNARGEQLSGFENFKADLVGWLKDKDETKAYVNLPTSGENNSQYILKKWDVEWMDMFWKKRKFVINEGQESQETLENPTVDDIYFTFLKRYLLNYYVTEGGGKEKNSKNRNNPNEGLDKDVVVRTLYTQEQEPYTTFEQYQDLFVSSVVDELTRIMDRASAHIDTIKSAIEKIPLLKNKNYDFLPSYNKKNAEEDVPAKVVDYNFQSRVMHYGICKYLALCDTVDSDAFRHWLRVLANLTYYDEISNLDEFIRRIRNVKKVYDTLAATEGHDIYNHKEGWEHDSPDDFEKQLIEEQKKIAIINEQPEKEKILKEKILMELEAIWIFEGRIDCLLDCLDSENVVDTVKGMIGDRARIVKEVPVLRQLFQALVIRTPDEKLERRIMFNNGHAQLRVLLNDLFKDEISTIVKNREKPQDIIDSFKDETSWKYPLVKGNEVWDKAVDGKLEWKNAKHYWYKGIYTNSEDICLEDKVAVQETADEDGLGGSEC